MGDSSPFVLVRWIVQGRARTPKRKQEGCSFSEFAEPQHDRNGAPASRNGHCDFLGWLNNKTSKFFVVVVVVVWIVREWLVRE